MDWKEIVLCQQLSFESAINYIVSHEAVMRGLKLSHAIKTAFFFKTTDWNHQTNVSHLVAISRNGHRIKPSTKSKIVSIHKVAGNVNSSLTMF